MDFMMNYQRMRFWLQINIEVKYMQYQQILHQNNINLLQNYKIQQPINMAQSNSMMNKHLH